MNLVPGAEFTVLGDEITWQDENIEQPSDEALQEEITRLENEQPLAELRTVRDRLLSETDWWASSDLIMSEEQTNYRQALRDITNTYQSLDVVVWPEKP